MSQFGIIVRADRCVGCHACAIACKEENQVQPQVFYTKIHRVENPRARAVTYFRMSCMHCDDPACMKVCPAKAIYRGKNGEVLVDDKKCIGCHMCESACPYGVPMFSDKTNADYFAGKKPLARRPQQPWTVHALNKAQHCTLCTHRTEKGQLPACVEACGIGALVFVDYENPTPETKPLIEQAVALNRATGTKPKVRFIGKHVDFAKMQEKL